MEPITVPVFHGLAAFHGGTDNLARRTRKAIGVEIAAADRPIGPVGILARAEIRRAWRADAWTSVHEGVRVSSRPADVEGPLDSYVWSLVSTWANCWEPIHRPGLPGLERDYASGTYVCPANEKGHPVKGAYAEAAAVIHHVTAIQAVWLKDHVRDRWPELTERAQRLARALKVPLMYVTRLDRSTIYRPPAQYDARPVRVVRRCRWVDEYIDVLE